MSTTLRNILFVALASTIIIQFAFNRTNARRAERQIGDMSSSLWSAMKEIESTAPLRSMGAL